MPETISSHLGISIIKEYSLASGSSTTLSPAIASPARMIRIVGTGDLYYAVGKAPVPTTILLPAGTIEYVAVKPGWFVGVKQVSVAGVVSIAECE